MKYTEFLDATIEARTAKYLDGKTESDPYTVAILKLAGYSIEHAEEIAKKADKIPLYPLEDPDTTLYENIGIWYASTSPNPIQKYAKRLQATEEEDEIRQICAEIGVEIVEKAPILVIGHEYAIVVVVRQEGE